MITLEVIVSEVPTHSSPSSIGEFTAEELRNLLSTLTGDERLSAEMIKDLPKIQAMAAQEIVAALITLEAENRLPASAIEGLPSDLTGADLVALLQGLATDQQLSLTKIKDRTKANITGIDRAINYRVAGNLYNETFQNTYIKDILKGDFWIASGVSPGQAIENGDWLIALTDAPDYTFTDTSKWMVMKFSRLANVLTGLWLAGTGQGSIRMGDNLTPGIKALAAGTNNTAQGDNSAAFGEYSKTYHAGEQSQASGRIAELADSQYRRTDLRKVTLSDVVGLLNQPQDYLFEPQKTYALEIDVVCRVSASRDAENMRSMPSRHWRFNLLVAMNGTDQETALSGGLVNTTGGCSADCQIALTPAYNGKLAIAIQGMRDRDNVWHAVIKSNEVQLNYQEEDK